MLITSLDNAKIKEYKKLQLRKYRDKKKQFIVEGEHLVLEAYKTGCIDELILEKDEIFPLNVETVYVTNEIINKISTLEDPQNVMALCHTKSSDFLGTRILLLDEIQDPGNLGTIIRSAVAFNIDTIVLGNNTVDVYNPKVVRASQGMIFHVNIISKSITEIIETLKKDNFVIYGTKVTHGESLKNISAPSKYAIVMGNEGNGMSDEVSNLCDKFIYIDMNQQCESLNVGVATSIILYQLSK